jgi:YidC/Oxa1 family membrane protein insertase
MKQMQLVQPKVDRLRKEYKDNPQKLNKEMLELYKKHKVNPFGGCLPMLLQMPIFIALYQALMRAIELKNAKFLWIKDLSGPDRAFLLPRTGIPVNILPILMAITMFFQQKLSTPSHASQDKEDTLYQQQKTMAIMMPVLFGVIFYNMPSALVLYWFTNTLIMFFQQARIMRNFHVEKEAVT